MIEAYPKEATDLIDQLRGSLVSIRQSAKAGTLNNDTVVQAISELIGDDEDDDQPQVAAERGVRSGKDGAFYLSAEEVGIGNPPLPGEHDINAEERVAELRKAGVTIYGDEQTMARLIQQEKEAQPAPRRQAVVVERQELTLDNLPLPGDTLTQEQLANVRLIAQAKEPLRFSGELTLDGAPVPL